MKTPKAIQNRFKEFLITEIFLVAVQEGSLDGIVKEKNFIHISAIIISMSPKLRRARAINCGNIYDR